MRHLKSFWVGCLVGVFAFGISAAKPQPLPYDEGSTGLAFALRKLPVTGSFLHTTAHPDDEDNALFVMLGKGRGLRTGLLTLTRGDGGQNEIGPELFQALGIIRTGELLSMHRWTGAEQYFTRAYEFGYSFSVEETLEKWGPEPVLADVVRLIRTFRPNVIVSLPRTGEGGGQHHQTSARLTAEAFRAAADPNRFPEQIREGLRPWQAKKLYERHRWAGGDDRDKDDGRTVVAMETGLFDPLYGRTYAQIGMEGRAMHKCQGMGQLIPLAGPQASQWKLVDSVIPVDPSEKDIFAGIDTSLSAIAAEAGPEADRVPLLGPGLVKLGAQIEAAQSAFDFQSPEKTLPYLAAGLGSVRELLAAVEQSTLSDDRRFQIAFLLRNKENDFVEAIRAARMLTVEAVVDDGLVVPGQEFGLTVSMANAGATPLPISSLEINAPNGWTVTRVDETPVPAEVAGRGAGQVKYRIRVAENAAITEPYWRMGTSTLDVYEIDERFVNQPWGPSELAVKLSFATDGVQSSVEQPAEYRYEGPWVGGEQRHDLFVVPDVSVRTEPEYSIIPVKNSAEGRDIRVTSLYNGTGKASGTLTLEVPSGWQTEPASATLEFARPGQSVTHIFRLKGPGQVQPGEFKVRAVARLGNQSFNQGYQVIDYDHIQRRHLYHPAEVVVKTVDVDVLPELRVGYIDGVGDWVPDALRQLGVKFDLLDADELAFGDLDRFDVILTGVRAYLVRDDLKANNSRLLEWVSRGGNLIVQYNKFEFNDQGRNNSPYAPYPAKVGRDRVTDENAPVEMLEPDNPIFSQPNRIGPADWNNWVQERGLYFFGERDSRYRDLVKTQDPFEYNSGPKPGALVEVDHGQGRWIYVGLGLWRQLPAGVPGAYRLLANLVSLPRGNGTP